MADLIAVVGQSGTGKSTSIENLDPKETFIINVAGKQLPFRGWKKKYIDFAKDKTNGNYVCASKAPRIVQFLTYINDKRPEIKNVVIEDSQYVMAFETMDAVNETGFKKFTVMAKNFYDILKTAVDMRDDIKVFCMTHEETANESTKPIRKIKTQGKMIDSAITVEGLFTYVFFTKAEPNDEGKMAYEFITQTDGTTTAKSPRGCFETLTIPNDLAYVVEKINEYNEG